MALTSTQITVGTAEGTEQTNSTGSHQHFPLNTLIMCQMVEFSVCFNDDKVRPKDCHLISTAKYLSFASEIQANLSFSQTWHIHHFCFLCSQHTTVPNLPFFSTTHATVIVLIRSFMNHARLLPGQFEKGAEIVRMYPFSNMSHITRNREERWLSANYEYGKEPRHVSIHLQEVKPTYAVKGPSANPMLSLKAEFTKLRRIMLGHVATHGCTRLSLSRRALNYSLPWISKDNLISF